MLIKIAYCLFFGLLNLYILAVLTKAIKINQVAILVLALLFVLAILIQFVSPPTELITNNTFKNLLFFSLSLIVLHFGSSIMLSIFESKIQSMNLSNKFLEQVFIPAFNFIRLKLIYVLVFIFQCVQIISK
tara:strand:- start:217 stop:609 length:393 start_codon:yes stop_codon:yes gene_type:complete